MVALNSVSFSRLVKALQAAGNKKCVVVEQCCGGLITASMMAQPGASSVLVGGSVVYDTKSAKPLLLNDEKLHDSIVVPRWKHGSPGVVAALPTILSPSPTAGNDDDDASSAAKDHQNDMEEEENYIASKRHWTAATSVAFCQSLGTDYAIAEAGASGPTFRPASLLTTGFCVVAVAGRRHADGPVTVLHQEVIRSNHADRERNMREFADAAAAALHRVVVASQQHPAMAAPNNNNTSSVKKTTTPIVSGSDTINVGSSNNNNKNNNNTPHDAVHAMGENLVLDRATHLRSNGQVLAAMELRATTKYLLLHQNKVFCKHDSSSGPLHVDRGNVDDLLQGMAYQKSFLGVQSDGSALFSLDILDKDFAPATAVINLASSSSSSWVDTRTGAPLFSATDRAAVLYATALARWQRKTRYCCQCGGPITFIDAGSCAECAKCHDKSWPRQDPSMIAIILSPNRERVLLARSKRHPPKVYSTLAGFIEAGETMEAAVAREAWEEAGVRVDMNSVRYVASQPWPFPQSTMLGFSAMADDRPPLQIDPNEIECAQWFEKQQVLEAAHASVGLATMQDSVAHSLGSARPDLKLILPPKGVIARQLLDAWLEDKLHE